MSNTPFGFGRPSDEGDDKPGQPNDPFAAMCGDMGASRGGALGGGGLPKERQPMPGPLIGMIRKMAGAMVGGQAGQALGALARDVVGSTDVGLPLAPEGVGALLPAGVTAFGEG